MNKGLAIIEVSDGETRSVFIDQDAVECARLNARTKRRVSVATAKRDAEAQKRRKAEDQAEKRKEYTVNTMLHVLLRCLIIVGAVWGCAAGMIHPVISIPVVVICLCSACLRLGAWLERRDDNG
ncbi:hypothetical protein [Succinimonas sp.]|uniref:hypothetical protein n=1 Tax=Succinimonas sp. TaxID=1936151 RepID=UPI00386349C1